MHLLLAWLIFKGTCAKPVECSSAAIQTSGERVTVTFSGGQSFSGARVGGDGPLFLSPQGTACRFYFTDHGTFTEGWESRLVAVECGRINFRVTP